METYIIDSYYDRKKDCLHIILKDDQKGKITKKIQSPKYTIKIGRFTPKIKYIEDSDKLENVTLTYKEYLITARLMEQKYKYMIANTIGLSYEDLDDVNINKIKDLERAVRDIAFKYPKNSLSRIFLESVARDIDVKYDIYDDVRIETRAHYKYKVIPYNKLTIGIFDLEVLSPGTISIEDLANKGESPLITATLYNSEEDIYKIYVLIDNSHNIKTDEDLNRALKEWSSYINEKEEGKIKFKIYPFFNEVDLIKKFLRELSKVDVIIGWNSMKFDMKYLYNRCKVLSETLDVNLLRLFKTYLGEFFPITNGISPDANYVTKVVHLDYIHLIKEFDKKTNYPTYGLDYIARSLLGKDAEDEIGKVRIKSINWEYYNNLKNFIYYNLIDVKLVKMIDDNMQFIRILFKIKEYTGGFTTSYIAASNYLDAFFIKQAKENNKSIISHIKTSSYYTKKIFIIYSRVNQLIQIRNKGRIADKPIKKFLYVLDMAVTKGSKKVKQTIKSLTEKLLLTGEIISDEDKKVQQFIMDVVNEKKERIYPFITKDKSYPGAYVKSPKPGVYKGVIDFDASLTGDHIVPIIRDDKFYEFTLEEYEFKEGDKSIGVNPVTLEPEIVEVEEKYEHNWKSHILEITLENNEKLTITPNHSIYIVNENNGLENIKGEDLKVGDYIPGYTVINNN